MSLAKPAWLSPLSLARQGKAGSCYLGKARLFWLIFAKPLGLAEQGGGLTGLGLTGLSLSMPSRVGGGVLHSGAFGAR